MDGREADVTFFDCPLNLEQEETMKGGGRAAKCKGWVLEGRK